MDALIFTITFFILQQIEGNLIYPYVVGNSVGLPSIWVLVAVTVGGSMMGIVGMLIFIPLCSVLFALLPVSYTHLDVYKRQGQGNGNAIADRRYGKFGRKKRKFSSRTPLH